jgi:hypothetical protein
MQVQVASDDRHVARLADLRGPIASPLVDL